VRVVPPGDTCRSSGLRGAWRLAARVPHQAFWKRVSPCDSRVAPGDNVEAGLVLWFACDVCGLQGFNDTLKVGLLVFLELWLGTYPLSCGLG